MWRKCLFLLLCINGVTLYAGDRVCTRKAAVNATLKYLKAHNLIAKGMTIHSSSHIYNLDNYAKRRGNEYKQYYTNQLGNKEFLVVFYTDASPQSGGYEIFVDKMTCEVLLLSSRK